MINFFENFLAIGRIYIFFQEVIMYQISEGWHRYGCTKSYFNYSNKYGNCFCGFVCVGLTYKIHTLYRPDQEQEQKTGESGQSNNEKAETGKTGAISGGCYSGKNTDSSYNYIFNGLRLP